MTDELTFDGITQPIHEWALDYGIPPQLIVHRLKKGWPVSKAVTQPMRVTADTVLDWMDRRYKPISIGSSQPHSPRDPRMSADALYEHDGTTRTLAQWADELGIQLQTLRGRLRNGWPIAKALTEPLGSRWRRGWSTT